MSVIYSWNQKFCASQTLIQIFGTSWISGVKSLLLVHQREQLSNQKGPILTIQLKSLEDPTMSQLTSKSFIMPLKMEIYLKVMLKLGRGQLLKIYIYTNICFLHMIVILLLPYEVMLIKRVQVRKTEDSEIKKHSITCQAKTWIQKKLYFCLLAENVPNVVFTHNTNAYFCFLGNIEDDSIM